VLLHCKMPKSANLRVQTPHRRISPRIEPPHREFSQTKDPLQAALLCVAAALKADTSSKQQNFRMAQRSTLAAGLLLWFPCWHAKQLCRLLETCRSSGTHLLSSTSNATVVLSGPNVVVKDLRYLPYVNGTTVVRTLSTTIAVLAERALAAQPSTRQTSPTCACEVGICEFDWDAYGQEPSLVTRTRLIRFFWSFSMIYSLSAMRVASMLCSTITATWWGLLAAETASLCGFSSWPPVSHRKAPYHWISLR